MEEQSERKDDVGVVVKEPVKTEGLVPSPETSERSESASSPPPNCSICLGKLINTSFTDSCLHQFCFTCLLQWSKIKTECPLCKQTFKSIIHNVRSEEDYDQYHVPRELAPQLPSSQVAATLDVNFELVGGVVDVGVRRFVYRTTMTPNRRFGVFSGLLNSEQVARRAQIPNMMIPSGISREERRYRRANPSGYRRNVYRLGERSNLLPDVYGRFRECSAEYYRRNPDELNRLIPWINRELQTLLNANEPHIAYVLRVIIDALTRYDMRRAEFRDTVRPYFGEFTDHFAHELLNYARTNFDLVGFDQYVTYPTRGQVGSEYVTRVISPRSSSSGSSSDDSDVRVLDQTIDVSRLSSDMPSVGPHIIDMPGPSSVGEAFHVPRITLGAPDILTISSSSSSSDECAVVGYVKPRHERTPEIIELVSSDGASEPANNYEVNSRTPPIHENEAENPGPSREERRRSNRENGSQRSARRASRRRWTTTSGSSDTDEGSVTEYSRHRRKKSFYRNHLRPRKRDHPRTTRSRVPTERSGPSRSPMKKRQRQISNSTSSDDPLVNRHLRRKIRERTQILRESIIITDSESSSTSTSTSLSGDWANRSTSHFSATLKIRKDFTKEPKRTVKAEFSCSEAESNERSEESCERRRGHSRRKMSKESSSTESTTPVANLNTSVQPVHATILRKDATKPDEWYVTKKLPRARSGNSSASLSSSSSSSKVKIRAPRRITLNVYRERRGNGNPGCSGDREPSRTKSDQKFTDQEETESENSSEASNESNSRGSAVSGRTRAKERSRGKSSSSKRKTRCETSDSSDSSHSRRASKTSGTRNEHGMRKHKDLSDDQVARKDEKQKKKHRASKSVGKGKKKERHRDQVDRESRKKGSSVSKRNKASHSRRYDQEQRHDHGKKHDQEQRNDHGKKYDQEERNDHGKKVDQEQRNDHAKKYDQEERNDHGKKHDQLVSNESSRKFNEQAAKSGTKRKSDHGRRNDELSRDDDKSSRTDTAGTSKHSQNEKDSPSKDKHKRKKKLKRRRSRSESKTESRKTRHRVARSSSCTAPVINHDG